MKVVLAQPRGFCAGVNRAIAIVERALALYAETVREAKALRKEYESVYGPITATSAAGKSPWQWSKNPWTWSKERS